MKDDPVPPSDHVSRYCPFTTISEDGRRVQAAAFMLGDTNDYLSVNWLEFLNLSSRGEEIEEIRKILSTKLRLGAKAKFAILNVGSMQDHVLRCIIQDFRVPRFQLAIASHANDYEIRKIPGACDKVISPGRTGSRQEKPFFPLISQVPPSYF